MITFKELTSPINLISFSLTIFFGILSIIFFVKSEKKSSISYQISDQGTTIFDMNNSSPKISISEQINTYKDSLSGAIVTSSRPINESVYLLAGIIWNSGNFSIAKNDIRIPLTLSLTNATRILDYSITKEIDDSISLFHLSQKNDNQLSVDWKYFDPGYGFKFQIIYTGNPNPGFIFEGKVLGISKFDNLILNEKRPTQKVLFISYSVLFVTTLVLMFKTKKYNWRSYSILILFLLTASISAYFYFSLKNAPF